MVFLLGRAWEKSHSHDHMFWFQSRENIDEKNNCIIILNSKVMFIIDYNEDLVFDFTTTEREKSRLSLELDVPIASMIHVNVSLVRHLFKSITMMMALKSVVLLTSIDCIDTSSHVCIVCR